MKKLTVKDHGIMIPKSQIVSIHQFDDNIFDVDVSYPAIRELIETAISEDNFLFTNARIALYHFQADGDTEIQIDIQKDLKFRLRYLHTTTSLKRYASTLKYLLRNSKELYPDITLKGGNTKRDRITSNNTEVLIYNCVV
jgi:hypothetical protein